MFKKIKIALYKSGVKSKYIEALYKEQPVRCAISTNPPPIHSFICAMKGTEEVLDARDVPHDELFTYKVLDHLINKWPGGLTSYNLWYVMHSAQDHGMLDKQFNPIEGSRFVNEEQARRKEIVKLGGAKALSIYLEDDVKARSIYLED